MEKESNVNTHFDPGGLRDRVVIVTGGGQGIGRALSKAYARAGAFPVIAELNVERGNAVAKEIAEFGARALVVETDVADYKSVERMTEQVLQEFGRIDVLVNNAAIFSTIKMRPFDQIPLEEWDRVMHVNTTGVYYCCRAVVAAMRKAKYGRIVNMSSGAAAIGRPNYLHYIASKSALVGMTRSLARELGPSGITVNAIMPGAVFTEIERETVAPEAKAHIVNGQCIQRAETPEDLLPTILFLSSEAAHFVTGQTIAVDGGSSFR